MNLSLVVMAAGLGSRYGGIKQMDGVGPSGESILEYSVYDALRSGFEKVVFVIRPDISEDFKTQIVSKFEDQIEVEYVYQTLDNVPEVYSVNPDRSKPLGTGHVVWCAREAIDSPFMVINADDFYGREAYEKAAEFYGDESNRDYCSIVAYKLANTLSDFGSVNRGECFVDENNFLQKVIERVGIEKKDEKFAVTEQGHEMSLDMPVSMNFWGFTPDFLIEVEQQLIEFLEEYSDELEKELYLPAIVQSAMNKDLIDVKVLKTDSQWYGMTYKDDKKSVESAVKGLIAQNVYPSSLW